MRDQEHRYEVLDEVCTSAATSGERFDRIAFAMRAVDLFKPPELKVVVYECSQRLRIERGRSGAESSWALVGIPPHASREQIAFELARLFGLAERPWVIPLLLAG